MSVFGFPHSTQRRTVATPSGQPDQKEDGCPSFLPLPVLDVPPEEEDPATTSPIPAATSGSIRGLCGAPLPLDPTEAEADAEADADAEAEAEGSATTSASSFFCSALAASLAHSSPGGASAASTAAADSPAPASRASPAAMREEADTRRRTAQAMPASCHRPLGDLASQAMTRRAREEASSRAGQGLRAAMR